MNRPDRRAILCIGVPGSGKTAMTLRITDAMIRQLTCTCVHFSVQSCGALSTQASTSWPLLLRMFARARAGLGMAHPPGLAVVFVGLPTEGDDDEPVATPP